MIRPQFRLARNLGTLWGGQILTKGVAFLAFAILARRLLPQSYGAVEYALGLATLAGLAIEGGLGSVGVRRLTQGQQSAEELASLIPAAQLCISALIAPAMILFTRYYVNDPDAFALTCAVALSQFIPPWKQEWLFQAKGMMTVIVIGQCVRVFVFISGCFLFVHGDAHVVRVGFIEIGSVLLSTFYFLAMQHRKIAPLRLRFAFHKLVDLMREGMAIGLGAICWSMFQYAPLFILAAIAGMTDTAYFGAAHRLGLSLVTFSWLYHFNLYPVISRRLAGDQAGLAQLIRASVRATAWGGVGLALALTLIAAPLLRLLFGSGFEAAAAAFSILVWTFPLTLLSGHARWLLIANNRGKDMLTAQMAGVVVSIPTAWALVGPADLGPIGAAMAMTLACAIVWAVSQGYAIVRGHEVPVLPALPAFICAMLIVAAAKLLGLDPWVALGGGVVLFLTAALLFDHNLVDEIRNLAIGQPPSELQTQ